MNGILGHLALMHATLNPFIDNGSYSERHWQPSKPRPKGYEHTGKSLYDLEQHKKHKQKLQTKRNAKKGIYQNKIKYKKKRG